MDILAFIIAICALIIAITGINDLTEKINEAHKACSCPAIVSPLED